MLRHYLDGLDKEEQLIALSDTLEGDAGQIIKDFQDHFRLTNNKSVFDYNTVIVSLYGYLERFIEDLISEYLSDVSRLITNFADLPAVIQTNHFSLSVDLSRKIDQQKYIGKIRVEEIVARLHTCFTTPNQYQLNIQAFVHHSANFRHANIVAALAQCGIQNITQSLKQAAPFVSFLAEEDAERDVKTYLSKEDDVVFFRLDDLANRRNDVSHGSPTDETLSNDILRTYINYVEAYAAGIDLMVYESTLPLLANRAIFLGKAIKIIRGHIVCFDLPAEKVSLGDTLIAKTQDTGRPFKGGQIREIRQGDKAFDTVIGGPDVQIGVRVDFIAKDNQEFYLLAAEYYLLAATI